MRLFCVVFEHDCWLYTYTGILSELWKLIFISKELFLLKTSVDSILIYVLSLNNIDKIFSELYLT